LPIGFHAGCDEEDIPLISAQAIYQHMPLTEKLVQSVNSNAEMHFVGDEAQKLGYPMAATKPE